MPNFPVTIAGIAFASRDELVAALRHWGSARIRRHPGDRHPADHWNDAMSKDPAVAPAVAEAAADLLRTSADSGELELVAHLAFPVASVELYQALLDRLEDTQRPLPPGHGLRHGGLSAEFHHRLVEWLPHGQSGLAGRARALVQGCPHPRAHVAFAARAGETAEELIQALRRTPDLEADPFLAVLAIAHTIRHSPRRVEEIARVLAEIESPAALRELVGREMARIHPAWHGQFGRKLYEALGLSAE